MNNGPASTISGPDSSISGLQQRVRRSRSRRGLAQSGHTLARAMYSATWLRVISPCNSASSALDSERVRPRRSAVRSWMPRCSLPTSTHVVSPIVLLAVSLIVHSTIQPQVLLEPTSVSQSRTTKFFLLPPVMQTISPTLMNLTEDWTRNRKKIPLRKTSSGISDPRSRNDFNDRMT